MLNKLKMYSPYIIAEIGVNHENKLSNALKMIQLAKKGGAHAVKFQWYTADKLVLKNSPAYWNTKKEKTKTQFELFKKYEVFTYHEYAILWEKCKQIGIDFLCTFFDTETINKYGGMVDYFKISSGDITNYPLLKCIAEKNKPVILSCGGSSIIEIMNAIKVLKSFDSNKGVILLHCVLNYPTDYKNANLLRIKELKKFFFEHKIGYSDHTIPDKNMSVLTSAYLLGAEVIEKHFTLNKNKKGNDHYHSFDHKDLKNFTAKIDFIKTITENNAVDENQIEVRRTIIASEDIKKGEIITEDKLITKRPGKYGLNPMHYWNYIIGKKALRDIKKDSYIRLVYIKE